MIIEFYSRGLANPLAGLIFFSIAFYGILVKNEDETVYNKEL
jgi:hypothetical protein